MVGWGCGRTKPQSPRATSSSSQGLAHEGTAEFPDRCQIDPRADPLPGHRNSPPLMALYEHIRPETFPFSTQD